MNQKAVTLSLVMAFIAIFFVQSYVSSIEESAKKKFGTEVMVLVASKNIKEMSTIDETMLEFKTVPKKFLEPAAISFIKKDDDKTPEKEIKNLAGSVTLVPIKEGEQITFNKLTEPSIRTGLAPQITPGKRAISIPVTAITGVSKLVKPGDRVDVIVIFDLGGGKEKSMAKTILQDVAILSIGKNVTNNIGRLVEKDPFSGKTKTKSLTAYVRGSKHTFTDPHIETDSSIEIDAIAGFELVIPPDFGEFIGYSYTVDWEQYDE